MIAGELDLDRAERDPAYRARALAFLVWGDGHERLPADGHPDIDHRSLPQDGVAKRAAVG